MTLCGVLVLAGCTDEARPEPPAPVVTTQEFEQRLTEYLSRTVTGALEPEAQASPPSHSRHVGCAELPGGGPTWGVQPRAEMTVSAGEKSEKYFEDVDTWLLREGFAENWVRPGIDTSADVWRAGMHENGTRMIMEMARGSGRFTVAFIGPCTWPSDRPGGPPSTGQLPPLPPPPGPVGTRDVIITSPCRSPKLFVYNRTSPPFAGRGPHHMAMVEYSDEESLKYDVILPPDGFGIRSGQAADLNSHDRVQLLVCVRVAVTRDSGQDVTCNYANEQDLWSEGDPFTFDLFESVYHVTVREARSGRVISEFTVPGRQGAKDSCPYRMTGDDRKLARGIDEAAFHRRLRPLLK
jgi:hypothetical protein